MDAENKSSSSGSEKPEKETSSMMDMLGHALGKTPADGKAAMHEEMAHTRLARVAADGGARAGTQPDGVRRRAAQRRAAGVAADNSDVGARVAE